MKKTFLLLLSLAVLLTMGAFVVKAVTQEAFTTNSFNFSGANLNNYVQNDVYKYICKNNECVSVKQATIKPSDGDYYNDKNACLKKCNTNPANVTTSGSATGGLNLNLNKIYTPPSSKPAFDGLSNGGSSLQGLTFTAPAAKPLGGTPPGIVGGIANPSTNFGGLSFTAPAAKPFGGTTPGISGGVAPKSLFGTNLQYSGSDIKPQGGTIPKNEVTLFGSLLQKFGIIDTNKDEIVPQGGKGNPTDKFEFYSEKAEINSGESVNLIWNSSEKEYIHCMFKNSYGGVDGIEKNKELKPNGILPVVFNYEKAKTTSDDFKEFKIQLRCYKSATDTDPGVVTEVIKVNAKTSDQPPTDPKKLSVEIIASPDKVTLKDNKASSKISWEAKNATSCSTDVVDGVTGWTKNDKLAVKSNSPVEVGFTKEGSYVFEIVCLDSDKKVEKGTKTITVSKDGEKPPEPGKPEPGTLGDYKNDCDIEIDKDSFDYNIVNREQAANVKITFSCKGKAKEESGHDVRPIGYGLFINETIGSQTKRYNCKEVGSKTPGQYLNGSESATLSCDFKNDTTFNGLFDMDENGNNKNQNQKMLIAYARFYTNQNDGSYWAGKYSNEPRIGQKNATRTPHLSFTGGKGNPGSDKSMFVQANKKDIKSSGEKVSITAGAKGYTACVVNSEELKDLTLSLTGTKEKLSLAPTPFDIPANSDKAPKNIYLKITCDDITGNPFMITVAGKEDPNAPKGEDPVLPDCNDKSEKPKACTIVPTISTPVVEINKASKTGGEIRGSVSISNCNWGNTGKIFLTTGLRMNHINIPMTPLSGKQITSALDRNWSIKWADLPEVTRNNILNTFNEKDDKGNYYSAVTIPFQYYSGQSIGTNQLSKDNTCGWVSPDSNKVLSITFKVKGAGNAPGNNGGDTDDDSTVVEKCIKVCKDNFNNLPETDMINAYGGNSKDEARQNCEAKCKGNPPPFSKKEPSKVVHNKCNIELATAHPYTFNIEDQINVKVTMNPRDGSKDTIGSIHGKILSNDIVNSYIVLGVNDLGGNFSTVDKIFSGKIYNSKYQNELKKLKEAILRANGNKITVPVEIEVFKRNRETPESQISCDKKVINVTLTSSDLSKARGKLTMNCVGCEQCYSAVLMQGLKERYLSIYHGKPKNLTSGTTELMTGSYRMVINCDDYRTTSDGLLPAGWTKDKLVKGNAFNNYFEIEAGKTTNLGLLKLKKELPQTNIRPLLDIRSDNWDTLPAGWSTRKLNIWFQVDGYAKAGNSSSIKIEKNGETFTCKLYINDQVMTQAPNSQKNRSEATKTTSVILSDYLFKTGKYKVYYKCSDDKNADNVSASGIKTVSIEYN